MFHVYDSDNRVTSNPISYNYLLKYFFNSKSLIDWNKISTLPEGHAYAYQEFKIVRVG
jgi:hypothetical protein